MAFRRRGPQKEEDRGNRQEDTPQSAIDPNFGFSEDEIAMMAKCKCPKKDCPIHPSEESSE